MFDEILIENFFKDIILDESPSLYNFKCSSNQIGCVFLKVENAWPCYEDVRMIQCLKRSKMTN